MGNIGTLFIIRDNHSMACYAQVVISIIYHSYHITSSCTHIRNNVIRLLRSSMKSSQDPRARVKRYLHLTRGIQRVLIEIQWSQRILFTAPIVRHLCADSVQTTKRGKQLLFIWGHATV